MGNGVFTGVVYQQIYEALCAYNLVFGGECNAPKPCQSVDSLAHNGTTHEQVSRQQIAYLQQRSPSEEEIHTVFDINLNPNLEKGQFTPTTNEMAADALTLLVGGTHTTSSAMVVTIWALLNNPQVMQRLKTELKAAMPRRDDVMDWAELEKLPYLVSKKDKQPHSNRG